MSATALAIGVGASVVGGIVTNAISGGGNSTGGSQQAAAAADPFASQRPQYQQQLQQMMTGSFSPQDPSYAWRFQQGIDATNTGAAASGMLNSGNRLLALENYGQGAASTEYANQFSRLSQLAGGNIGSPAAAGQIIQGQNTANQGAASAIGNQVSTAVKGWGNQLNSGTGGDTGFQDTAGSGNITQSSDSSNQVYSQASGY